MNCHKKNMVDRILLITVISLGNLGGVNFSVIFRVDKHLQCVEGNIFKSVTGSLFVKGSNKISDIKGEDFWGGVVGYLKGHVLSWKNPFI